MARRRIRWVLREMAVYFNQPFLHVTPMGGPIYVFWNE